MPLSKARDRERKRLKGILQPNSNLIEEEVLHTSVTQAHPIVFALADPIKREKLRKICASLRSHSQLSEVYYGCRRPISMDEVETLLTAFP